MLVLGRGRHQISKVGADLQGLRVYACNDNLFDESNDPHFQGGDGGGGGAGDGSRVLDPVRGPIPGPRPDPMPGDVIPGLFLVRVLTLCRVT